MTSTLDRPHLPAEARPLRMAIGTAASATRWQRASGRCTACGTPCHHLSVYTLPGLMLNDTSVAA